MQRDMHSPDFEQVYQRCEFAPLVKLAIVVAVWANKLIATGLDRVSEIRSARQQNHA